MGGKVTRLESFEHNVRTGDQVQQTLSALRPRDVQRNAALSGIEVCESKAAFRPRVSVRKWRFESRRIAARRFDFDDVHSQIAEQLPAKRSHGGAQVENPVAG